jgi:quercetin dioxygenase-like cupin family protein
VRTFVLTATLIAAFAAVSSSAQEMPRSKVTPIVSPSEISGIAGHEVLAITNDFVPGAGTPRHVHPGDQWTVVMDGEVTMIINDGAPRGMKVGEQIHIPAGVPHETYNRTDKPARTVEIFILEKGKPVITFVPRP